MWWKIISAILNKNNAPAWQKANSLGNYWNMSKGFNSIRNLF